MKHRIADTCNGTEQNLKHRVYITDVRNRMQALRSTTHKVGLDKPRDVEKTLIADGKTQQRG